MSGRDEQALGGWREIRDLAAGFWREMRGNQPPLPVLYLLCDGCNQVAPRISVRKHYSVTPTAVDGGTPESVCEHSQIHVVNDEVPADTTMICAGRRHRRFGSKRSRKRCGQSFTVPASATLAICPWYVTRQPGPGRGDDIRRESSDN